MRRSGPSASTTIIAAAQSNPLANDTGPEGHRARRLYGHQGQGEVDRGVEEKDDQQTSLRTVVGLCKQYRQGDYREREEGEGEAGPARLPGPG